MDFNLKHMIGTIDSVLAHTKEIIELLVIHMAAAAPRIIIPH